VTSDAPADAKHPVSTRQTLALPLPPAAADLGGFPVWHVHAGTTLLRVTTSGYGPWWFSSDGAGRFDLAPPRGTCYLADDEMGALLEVLAARRLFLVDAYTSSQSVAFDEARDVGVRAARRQILVDHARGEVGDRARWDEVAGWAERRGEVIVVAHGHPLTVRLLKEYVPRWEARGLRLVPVSQLAR